MPLTWLLANWKLLLVGLLLALLGLQTVRIAELKQDASDQRAAAAETRLLADRAQRTEEARRQAAVDREVKDAQTRLAAARAEAAAAAHAADQLRSARDAAVARARAHTCPAAPGAPEPAGDPIGMLAFVQGRIDARAGLLAGVADERGDAGGLCERISDRLQPPGALTK